MPATPSPAQSEAARLNRALSAGPATDAGKARSSLSGVRHGLRGRTFFLLPDEDAGEFRQHEAMWLAVWSPRDLHEQEAAEAAIRAMWREVRAGRLEAQVLGDLFAAGEIADSAERDAAKAVAFKALGTLLRYRARIEREHRQAMEALGALRQRQSSEPMARAVARRGSVNLNTSTVAEPAIRPAAEGGRVTAIAVPDEPEQRPINRHQRRALAAIERQAVRRAA